jgi:hypothetical protein
MRIPLRITALALVLAVGASGAAQAEAFNIFSASKSQEAARDQSVQLEQARYGRRYGGYRGYGYRRGWNPGAAFALGTIGTIGAIAGAAAYNNRYYCDPYYEYCGPRRVYRRYYGAPRYYGPGPYRYY